MGVQTHVGFGYGVQITEKNRNLPDEEQDGYKLDMWDVVEERFPLLGFSLAGNYLNQNPLPSVIYVKASGTETYSMLTQVGTRDFPSCPTEGLVELRRLLQEFNLEHLEVSWLLWSYQG